MGEAAEPLPIAAAPGRPWWPWWILAAAGLAGGIIWATSSSDADGPRYRTTVVERGEVVQTVEASGRIEARDRHVVVARVSSRLEKVHVQVSDRVEAGQILADLDPATLHLQARAASAAVVAAEGVRDQARARLEDARRSAARIGRLRDKGQASEADLSQAQAAVASAQGALRSAEGELRRAQAELEQARQGADRAQVVAPAAGVVLSVPDTLGTSVGPNGPTLFELSAPLQTLQVDAQVGEADIGWLRPDLTAEVTVQAFPGRTFPAHVESLGLVARSQEGQTVFPVRLKLPNPEGRLRPGMSASVRFEVARVSDVLVVRDSALRFQPPEADAEPRTRVYRVGEGDALEPIPVELGLSDGLRTEIRPRGELRPGDEVAIGWTEVDRRNKPSVSLGGGR